MLDDIDTIAAKAEIHMKTSHWIVKEVNKLVAEYEDLDDNVDVQALDDLYDRMEHLQGRLEFESVVYRELTSKLEDMENE